VPPGGNSRIENLERDYKNDWRWVPAKGSFTLIEMCSTSESNLFLKNKMYLKLLKQRTSKKKTSSKQMTGTLSEIIKISTLNISCSNRFSN
jgi:hypothetical protein